jgi:YVTN family beta-propeller protein
MTPLSGPLLGTTTRPHWTPHECASGLLAVGAPIGRRSVLKGAAALTLSTRGVAGLRPVSASLPAAVAPLMATPTPGGHIGYAFNAKSQDVTLFDPTTAKVLATRPLGKVVRWLSNEQRYWDGRYLWTYDFPDDEVQVIAVDSRAVTVARSLATGGAGPAHSLMLTPDRSTAWVNVAGGDYIAVLDLDTSEVVDEIRTGKFPWDLHFTPDGRFGFTPERDQDTVSKIDLVKRRIVKRVEFPAGSKPYMLRVSPDGSVVWVQMAGENANAVLDAESMETLHTEPLGRGPVQSAFGPPGGRYGLVTHLEEPFLMVLDRATGRSVQRIDVGGPQANVSFMPDGATAYVTVTSRNEVVAIDMVELVVTSRIPVGEEPMGLVVFDPTAA